MKVILTRQNNDGTYDQVGMDNIMLISDLKADWAIDRRARAFGRGRKVRLEYFTDYNFYADKPFRVRYVD